MAHSEGNVTPLHPTDPDGKCSNCDVIIEVCASLDELAENVETEIAWLGRESPLAESVEKLASAVDELTSVISGLSARFQNFLDS